MFGLAAVTIALSAFLLFWIQLVFGKLLLPLMGGVPAVWNTCLLFYQACLLLGYYYSHASINHLGAKSQPPVHMILLLLGGLFLPAGLSAPFGLSQPNLSEPIAWVLTVLVVSIGPLLFALSATAPLLQRWHALAERAEAHRSYSLYAFSNAGSLGALVVYLGVLEPWVSQQVQLNFWSIGYVIFAFLLLACALMVRRSVTKTRPVSLPVVSDEPDRVATPVRPAVRIKWLMLSFVPSSLLQGVTTYITTDIAPVPLLWVLPLSLYMLTFILVFMNKRPVVLRYLLAAQPLLILPFALMTFWGFNLSDLLGARLGVTAHLVLFFVNAMVCHGELSNSKPDAAHLTDFYLWLSLGGVFGGLFNILIAPLLFTDLVEYPIAIAAACLLWPSRSDGSPRAITFPDFALAASITVLIIGISAAGGSGNTLHGPALLAFRITILGLGVLLCSLRRRRLVLAAGVAALFISTTLSVSSESLVYRGRNFFGTHSVVAKEKGGRLQLYNGKTKHGEQYRSPDRASEPLAYYSRREPFGIVYAILLTDIPIRRIGVIGLGAGTLAAYATADQRWLFYEIDPAIAAIARNPAFFTYLSNSQAPIDIILGDGRLSIEHENDHSFDMIVVDAFTSDAIPVHMLTREAFSIFLSKLTRKGAILYHISNKHLDLQLPLNALRKQHHLDALYCNQHSTWFVVGNDLRSLQRLVDENQCVAPREENGFRIWTDDYSSLWSVMNISHR